MLILIACNYAGVACNVATYCICVIAMAVEGPGRL